MNKPEMKPVESSMVNAIGYDADTSTLWVEYKGGKLYTYANVGADIWKALETVQHLNGSVGNFINKSIKPHYIATKVEG